MLNRLAVYARVSSDDQAERGTIENQLEFARKYADLHQLEIVKWYKDDGVTGTIPLDARPAGRELLEDAKNGQIDLLLIYRLDRLGRSARIILNAVHELEGYGVKIRSMTEPFDTGDPSGRFLLTILAGVADLERETILERMWYGANRAARTGKWLGGIVPYGYRVNREGFLEINEDPLPHSDMSEAGVVRLIFHMIANQGHSCIKVADYLNALGVPTSYTKDDRKVTRGKRKEKTSGIWRPARIRNIIINTTYKGLHQYGKRSNRKREIIEREVPAIVDVETWEKAQQVLKNNQIEALRNTKNRYLLRGLMKCQCCGLTYVGANYRGSKRALRGYYVCTGKQAYRGPLQGKCPSKNIPQDWIEDVVWKDCLTFIHHPGEALKEIAATLKTKQAEKHDLESERTIIRKAIEDKDIERQSILDLFRKNIITFSDLEKQIQKINQEKELLEQRLRDIQSSLQAEQNYAMKTTNAIQLLHELRDKLTDEPSFEMKREIVKTLVQSIQVHTIHDEHTKRPRASVTIKYSFSKDVIHTDTDSSKIQEESGPGM
ncbi:recombinase family protein [Brevibacillus aydinogluensis]|jgi:site-specific DNA recombinase|uniref:recombinase family protein n=1 Tax=Brevibacillus aydinogluensis TaxID=927786 RepID=UPI002892EE9D|nr:recombinase family protein [Brevibacillus aydinogluensis]